MKVENIQEGRKYTSLLVSITLFLLIIIGLFVLSDVTSRQGQANNERINVATLTRDAIQTINKDVFAVSFYRQKEVDGGMSSTDSVAAQDKAINDMREVSDFLQVALTTFKQGGDVVLPDETVEISALKDPEIVESLDNITAEWNKMRAAVKGFLADTSSTEKLDALVKASEEIGAPLYGELDEFSEMIHEQTHARALLLETIQTVGIGVAIVYFIIFVFFIVRRLKRGDLQLAAARKETTEIMQTIEEGLFLIDEDLQVGQQTSEKLDRIIPGHTFQGQSLEEILQDLVGSNDLENTRRFIKQLFNERIDEQLIEDLNPLQRVVIRVEHDDEVELRYVRFIFNRVWEDDAIQRVLVTVTDITDAVRLEQRLEKERAENEQHIELLMKVLQISPPMLASFLRTANHLTENVNTVLKRRDYSISDLKSKAREIFRDVHSFKGESSALGLDKFVDDCEIIEDCLKTVQKKVEVSGNDFMPVTIALNDLIERIHAIENMQTNIEQVSSSKAEKDGSIVGEVEQYYEHFAKEVAQRNHKEVTLDITDYDMTDLSEKQHDSIKEMVVQFIRNAVVHGIETPSVRQSLDKNPVGHLTLSLKRTDGGHILSFADDGCGLRGSVLREKIKQLPEFQEHPEVVDEMTPKELVSFIFNSGFSTAEQSGHDAGRGVGMDVIKDRIKQMGGRISLKSRAEMGTTFTVVMP